MPKPCGVGCSLCIKMGNVASAPKKVKPKPAKCETLVNKKGLLIVLLDWDGPVSNSRTWGMPFNLDPVSINLLNTLYSSGAYTVLTSTIRTHFKTRTAATKFMTDRGINIRWLGSDKATAFCGLASWRTDMYRDRRHIEFLKWHSETSGLLESPVPVKFIAYDDEKYPEDVCLVMNIFQPRGISCDEGLNHMAISDIKKIMKDYLSS